MAAPFELTADVVAKYSFLAAVAGFVGGFLGIGGGMIIGPVMLDMGLQPQVVQATTAMFVFLSSALAVLQFANLGMNMPEFMIFYGIVVSIGTQMGIVVTAYCVRVYKRASIIVLSLALLFFVAIVMMLITGFFTVYKDVTHENWDALVFSYAKFCDH